MIGVAAVVGLGAVSFRHLMAEGHIGSLKTIAAMEKSLERIERKLDDALIKGK